MHSFFDKHYQTPLWFKKKFSQARRKFLKSAAGSLTIASLPFPVLANASNNNSWQQSPLWQTLNAVLDHLLPASNTGPSAKDIHALQYLYNVVNQQPTDDGEISFIKQGVGWLNGYSKSQLAKPFIELTNNEKERVLRAVSQSQAGDDWLSTLISYIYEAMLTPSVYGGNPDHIGEKWLAHQAGFPLPTVGTRYYELPGAYRISHKLSVKPKPTTQEKAAKKATNRFTKA